MDQGLVVDHVDEELLVAAHPHGMFPHARTHALQDEGFLLAVDDLVRRLAHPHVTRGVEGIRPGEALHILHGFGAGQRAVVEVIVVAAVRRHLPAHAPFVRQAIMRVNQPVIPGRAGVGRRLRPDAPDIEVQAGKGRIVGDGQLGDLVPEDHLTGDAQDAP